MNAQLIEELEAKIKELYKTHDKNKKETTRNQIFQEIKPLIDNYLKSSLKYRGIYMDDSERLSFCWDSFEFCLTHYKPDKKIPLLNHFYNYTKFFLLKWLAKKQRADNQTTPSAPEDEKNKDDLNVFYEQIDDLKQFRETLPDSYKSIFDDAVLSMSGRTEDKIPYRKSDRYSYYKYCESKNAFKIIIDFLLRR